MKDLPPQEQARVPFVRCLCVLCVLCGLIAEEFCLAPTTLCGRVQRDNVRWSAGLRPGLYGGLSRTRRTGGRRSGGGVEKPTLCALCDGESGQGFYSYTTRINSISDCVNSLNLHPAPMSDDSDYIHGASIFVGGA